MKGYNVLLMDGHLDPAMVGMMEQKLEKSRFVRVDSDIVDKLIQKEDDAKDTLDAAQHELLVSVFKTQMPKIDKMEFQVDAQPMSELSSPVTITQSEYMRRMKDMSRLQPGMSFYSDMPDMYTVVLNTNHSLVKEILQSAQTSLEEAIKPLDSEIKGITARRDAINQSNKDKKYDEISQESKDELSKCESDIQQMKDKKSDIVSNYASGEKKVHQLIDLALLQNGMLKGEALSNFVKRSIEMI